MAKYTFYLTDGSALVDVYPNESNGPGASSSPLRPRQIIQPNILQMNGDLSFRFVSGFEFDINDVDPLDPSPYMGTYTVDTVSVVDGITIIKTTTDIVPPANQKPSFAIVPPTDIIPTQDSNIYNIVWKVAGNHTDVFGIGGKFIIIDQDEAATTYTATDVVYNVTGDVTAITTQISSQTTPVVAQSGTITVPLDDLEKVVIQYTVPAASSLGLVGMNVMNYNGDITWGQIIQQNLIWLMQNFAGTIAPENPVVGQSWFDTSTNTVKHYTTGGQWV